MTHYHTDINAWSLEQAGYLRAGRFDKLDFENIAEEILDVGKSEKRELMSRLAVLLCHLLKCQYQPEFKGASWERTIKEQRKAINLHLKDVPSLKPKLLDPDFIEAVWADAVTLAIKETGLADFPEVCPWVLSEILD
jgi:hypothetical protein